VLVVRRAQLDALGEPRRLEFVERTARHLARFFPERCAALGEEEVKAAVQHGIRRAAAHGFTTERDVCKYIDLMFLFGWDFDRGERWAAETLAQSAPAAERLEALFDRAMRRASRAPGIQPRVRR
jgi:hypothetical protein